MTDKPKLILYLQDTCMCSTQGVAEFFANKMLDCTRAILVTNRPDVELDLNTECMTPAEFTTLSDLGAIKRGRMAGAALVIDAQPVYDSGRTLHTIKTDVVLQLARKAVEQFGKVMNYLIVVCDEKEVAAIKAALEPEVAEC